MLNLNVAFLIAQRRATLDAFQGALAKRGQLPRAKLEKWLRQWNGESETGDLREFCQVVVYWLRKRLSRPYWSGLTPRVADEPIEDSPVVPLGVVGSATRTR